MHGRRKQPELTAQTARDGWIRTVDIGHPDDGCLFLVGRCNDLIKVQGGGVVHPNEIEAVLLTVPAVARCRLRHLRQRRGGTHHAAVVPAADRRITPGNSGPTSPTPTHPSRPRRPRSH
ncbi:hypothetical protein ACH4OX_06250 [Streptomyces roseolus]|uniref:hypothetical protein n=1 Tax=Streptomyces roseolus TaxID=67358 RepID=UPI00378A83F8